MDRSPMKPDAFNHLYPYRYGQAHTILVNRHDIFVHKFCSTYGEYSPFEADLFHALVRPGDHVLNVGANVGANLLPLADLTGPTGVVFAIEPQRIPFQTLCANIALNSYSNVYAIQAAMGNDNGVINVPSLDPWVKQNTGGVTLTQPWEQGEQVRLRTLDSFGFRRLDFILMDVEGMEPQVLEGGLSTLAQLHPAVYLELLWNHVDILEWLSALGYNMWTHNAAHAREGNYLGARVDPGDAATVCPMLLAIHPSSDRQLTPEQIRDLGLYKVVETVLKAETLTETRPEVAA